MASNQFDSQASTNYKEAFALFDKRGNGRCTADSLGDLLRACGQNPTIAEIQDLQKGVGSECECRRKGVGVVWVSFVFALAGSRPEPTIASET